MSARRLLYKLFFGIAILCIPIILTASPPNNGKHLNSFAINKEIPAALEKPILKALSYFPELRNVHIIFWVQRTFTPLSTRPAFASMVKRKSHRTYIITISNKTIDTLNPLLFQNLDFEEQVGIMGHELSHVVDFSRKNLLQSGRNVIGHLSKRYIDKMEFNTDLIAIQHGLGKYLEAYSSHVRQAMHVHYWRGVDHVDELNDSHERYMNPDTIEKYMEAIHSR